MYICPYYFSRTPANASAVYCSRDTGGNHVTSILHCHWLVTSYGLYVIILSIKFIKNANECIMYNLSKEN